MVNFGAAVVSYRPGQIRLEDIRQQVRDLNVVVVTALDGAGARVNLQVRFTDKWAATGWQTQLQCAACGCPARVLRVTNGSGACGRCSPRSTEHHNRKNLSGWRGQDAIANAIVRGLLKSTSATIPASVGADAARLDRTRLARASAALENAMRTIQAADAHRSRDVRSR